MKPKPSRDPIATFERDARAARRVGEANRCSRCGEDRPRALIPDSNPTICANCRREELGKSPLDDHHPAGQANHRATTPIPANDHRAVLSPKQYEWSPETWKNTSGSPLLAGAACIRGYCETNDYLVADLLLPKVEMLEALDAFLKKKFGSEWWAETEMERFAPKRKPKPRGSGASDCYFCGERFRDFAPSAEHVKAG